MRKLAIVVAVLLATASLAHAQCVKIQSGTITDVNGNVITTGYDQYGYNYQAHIFNGLLENYSRPSVVATSGDVNLVMKWSDDWLANVACGGATTLARGYNAKTGEVAGTSLGWCTNHFEGDYEGTDGEMHHYTEEVKIVYVGPAPSSGTDPWEATRIWNSYAVIEDVINDAFGGFHGVTKDKLVAPGLGRF